MANQRFTLQFDFEANMGQVKAAVADLQKSLQGVNLPANLQANFEKLFGKLANEMTEFEALTKKGFSSMADVNKAQSAFGRIQKMLNQLGIESSRIKGLDANKLLPPEVAKRVDDLTKKWAALQAQSEKKDKFTEKIKTQTKAIQDQQREVNKLRIKRDALSKENQAMGAQKGVQESKKRSAQKDLDSALSQRTALEGKKGGKSSAEYAALGQEITRLGKVISAADNEIARLTTNINKNKTTIIGLDGAIDTATTGLNDMQKELAEMQSFDLDVKELTVLRQELAQILGLNIDEISTDLEEIKKAISGIPSQHLKQLDGNLKKIDASIEGVDSATDGAARGMRELAGSAEGLDRAAQDMENLKNQVLQFFSITNSIQLFKRAVTSALNTVKELDTTMTEAAVVTDFSVGDMWDKLPEYSAQARQLGVSINGTYQATTLYYQQGLKTNEAMALGVETMKMAKIAGMESAEATKAMTAALRGFNMELNETSATRVNDVYSELAAVTAADTEQIATAMSKTASIAAAANMEFETTAALLAQIIETTQEAPETAGTAMKTIIARFSEVKSLRDQGLTSGEDSEGEIIDVNKIQTALRTVGISMEGFFAGTEGLDSILLKLADKWGSLDTETQRYIATMAAGSRQQSRFIAMMSDYGRTTELVSAANNSAGASQKQFEKTLESMETKLANLKTAWEEFTMGLANNEILKSAVDFLTLILNTVNKLTESLSGGNGLAKSIISLITVIGALKGGGAIFNKALGGIGQSLGVSGQKQPVDETITRETFEDGRVVETIVRNPQQQGEQAGQKAGTGFVAGFKRAISSDAKGMRLESMFTTGPAAEVDGKNIRPTKGIGGFLADRRDNKIKKKHERRAGWGLQEVAKKGGKQDYLTAIADINAGDTLDLTAVNDAYDEIIAKGGTVEEAAAAANAKVGEMGGTLMNVGQTEEMVAEQTNGLSLNMGALGGAVMGVGGALGLLSSLFESLGMEEEAEVVATLAGVFMGLGSVMSLLSSIAPVLGMSFTTAGVQITTAGVTSQLAWWWVFLIIAAIAALIALVVALVKVAKDNSLEERMKAAAEATERAKEVADEAKNAYEDLLSAKEGYDELQDQLDNLIKGTTEWKQALIESNQQVLELLKTYPQLAQFLGRGEHGQLIISDEGWDQIISDQQQAVRNSSAAVLSSQIAEARLTQENANSKLTTAGHAAGIYAYTSPATVYDESAVDAIYQAYLENASLFESEKALNKLGGQIGYKSEDIAALGEAVKTYAKQMQVDSNNQEVYQNKLYQTAGEAGFMTSNGSSGYGLDKAALQKMHEAYQEYGGELFALQNGEYSSALNDLAGELGYSADRIYQMRDALIEYDNAMSQSSKQMMGQAEAMLMAGVSQETQDYEYGDAVIEGMAQDVIASQETKEKDIANKIYDNDGKKESENNEYFQQLMKENNLTSADMTGDDLHDLQVLYAKMAGISVDKIPDGIKKDKNKLAAEIGKIQAGKDAAKKTDQVAKNMAKLDKSTQRQYAIAMSKDVTKATRKDATALANMDMESYAKTLGYGSAREMALAKGYQDTKDANGNIIATAEQNFKAETQGLSKDIEKEFDKISTKAKNLDLEDSLLNKKFLENATAKQTEAYVDLMGQAAGAGADAFSGMFGKLMSSATEDQQQQILDALGTFDFTKAGEVEQFMLFLETIGISLPETEARAFANQLKKIGDGFRQIDATQLKEGVKTLLDLADELESRKDSEGISQEEKDLLINNGVATESDFVWDGQTWQYLDGPLRDLTKAINDNTETIVESSKQELQNQIELGEKTEELIDQRDEGENLQFSYYNSETGSSAYETFNKKDFLEGKIGEDRVESLRGFFGLDSSKTGAEIMQYYKQAISSYSRLNENKVQLDQLENTINPNQNAMLMSYDTIKEETHYVDERPNTTFEKGIVPRQFRLYDPGSDTIKAVSMGQSEIKEGTSVVGGPTEDQQKQLKGLAKMYGVSQTAIDKFTEAMKSNNAQQRQAALTALKNAIELKKQEKQYGKTMSRLQDVSKQYATVEKGMSGYEEAIYAYGEALELDMTDASNWGFVIDNMELIRKAAEGDIQAILDLNKKLAEEHNLKITADGDFDLYNSKVDMANQATQDFLKEQYKAGSMRLVEITAEQEQEYIVPDGNGGFKMETVKVGQTIQVLQPADAASIERSLETAGASSKKPEPIENPYDKYYNSLEKINDLLRERERLERAYQRLTRKGLRNVNDVRKNQQEQISNLRDENAKQETMITNRLGQIQDLTKKSPGMKKYVQVTTLENGDKSLRIDWDKIDKVYRSGNEEEVEKIEKFLSENEELLQDIYDRENTIQDNLDKEYELLQQGKEEYMSLEDQIKTAIETNAQKEIDRLSAINDSINDTNAKLLDSMQQQLDEYRQNRDNAKTEEELSDKQRRLAYLQQDTSGANALEIMQLQKELEEGQEDYTDTLIDQKISELQKQNDQAAEQRQEQIDIMNAQLRHYIDSGEVWQEVNRLLSGAIDADGSIKQDSELIRLLKEANGYDALSEIGQLDWYKELLSTIANGFNWLSGDGLLASFWEGQEITFSTADGIAKGVVNADGTVTDENGKIYSNVRWNGGNNFSTEEKTYTTEEETKPTQKEIKIGGQINAAGAKIYTSPSDKKGANQYFKNDPIYNVLDEKNGYLKVRWHKSRSNDVTGWFKKSDVTAYKTGGLADFTGPAWLDGTKSKPEYILNADQTKAFFSLVDVLSSLQTSGSKASQNSGDNTYDIDINVESIGSDYDVEQLANTVKRLINEDARYRNNNTINLMR